MGRTVGTVVRGIRTPIVKQGDDIVAVVVESLLNAAAQNGFQYCDRDVVGITESVVARAQGNYAPISAVAKNINQKFSGEIALLFPILSRNRFSLILKGIAQSGKKIHLFLNYPSDEVGNQLMDVDLMDERGINPHTDFLTEAEYRRMFGDATQHPFTGIDYVNLYKELAAPGQVEVYLANDPRAALTYSKEVLIANIHDRGRIKRNLTRAGAKTVYALDDLLTESIDGSGFNPDYGLLGSNKATEDSLKLFPRDCHALVEKVQQQMLARVGKKIEVMVYGDGAFKDPQGKIWELADPVVSPGFTQGLCGLPNEIKIKYVADNEFGSLSSDELTAAVKSKVRGKADNLCGRDLTLGTTPRQLTDLLGSLCDLTSGSGDKGTPVILIQGYFDNYSTD